MLLELAEQAALLQSEPFRDLEHDLVAARVRVLAHIHRDQQDAVRAKRVTRQGGGHRAIQPAAERHDDGIAFRHLLDFLQQR